MPKDYHDLLDSICEYVSTSRFSLFKTGKNGELQHPWDGSVFKEFVDPDSEHEETFKEKLEEGGVGYKTNYNRMHKSAIGQNAAKVAFWASAQAHERTLVEHLQAYLITRIDKPYQLKGILKCVGHEQIIKRLLERGSGDNLVHEQAQSTIRDIKFASYRGIKSSFLQMDTRINISNADILTGVDFDIVAEVDTSNSEFLINKNHSLIEFVKNTSDQLRSPKRNFPNVETTLENIYNCRKTFKALKDFRFHLGFLGEYEEVFTNIDSTQNDDTERAHDEDRIKDMVERLQSNKFNFDLYFKSGLNLLQAFFKDLDIILSKEKNIICIHLINNSIFPEVIWSSLINHEIDFISKDKLKIIISGYPNDKEAESWPNESTQQHLSDELHVDKDTTRISEIANYWSFQSYEIDALINIENTFSLSLTHRAVCYSLITGRLLSDSQDAANLLGFEESDTELLRNYLDAYFGGLKVAPLPWRKVLIQRVSSKDFSNWFKDVSIEKRLFIDDINKWRDNLLYFCITQDVYYIDLLILNSVRGNGVPQDLVIIELSLIVSSCRFLSNEVTKSINSRLSTMKLIATGKTHDFKVLDSFRFIADNYEEHIPSELMSEIYYQIAFIFYVNNNHTDSLENTQLALLLSPNNFRAHNLEGLGYFENGEHENAVNAFRQSISINNGYSHSHYNLGVTHEHSNDYKKSANRYVACLLIEPEFYEAIFNLSNVLIELDCYQEAAAIAAYGSIISPLFEAELCCNLAIALLEMGRSMDGIHLLKYIAEHNSADYIKYNLAYTYCSQAKFYTAKEWIKQINQTQIGEQLGTQVALLNAAIKSEIHSLTEYKHRFQRETDLSSLNIGLFISYIEDNGFRKDSRVETTVRHALKKPFKHPLHHASSSVKKKIEFNRDIIRNITGKTAKELNKHRQRKLSKNHEKRLLEKLNKTKSKLSIKERDEIKEILNFHRLPSYSGG